LGGHILDVGANVGYTATVFAGAIAPGFQVFAFEPEPVNVGILRRLLKRRGLEKKVVPVQAAVGAHTGIVCLAINSGHPGDHRVVSVPGAGKTELVPMITIDEYIETHNLSNVRFMKIDVQGLELSVSRGMERLLAVSPRLAIVFEYSDAATREPESNEGELLAFYLQRGFTLQLIGRRGDLVPVTAEVIDREHRRRGYANILAVRENSY
jgi:FkbM family methyltransferase